MKYTYGRTDVQALVCRGDEGGLVADDEISCAYADAAGESRQADRQIHIIYGLRQFLPPPLALY